MIGPGLGPGPHGATSQLDPGVEQGPSLRSCRKMGLLAAGRGTSLNVLGGSEELGLWSQTWLGSQACRLLCALWLQEITSPL